MKVIILAAGKGNRLKESLPNSFPYVTKSLVSFNGETALQRLINQLYECDLTDIYVVIGHKSEDIKRKINSNKIKFVMNKNYNEDSNLLSLFLGVKKIKKNIISQLNEGLLIIEADSIFNVEYLKNFIKHIKSSLLELNNKKIICWTSKGFASKEDKGGFLEPSNKINNNNNGLINDAYIKNSKINERTLKMYGVTWLNKKAILEWYKKAYLFITEGKAKENPLYFHDIIFSNKESFTMMYYDFGVNVLSFNNFEEYLKCLNSL